MRQERGYKIFLMFKGYWPMWRKLLNFIYKGFSHTYLPYHIKITICSYLNKHTSKFYPIFFTQKGIPLNYIKTTFSLLVTTLYSMSSPPNALYCLGEKRRKNKIDLGLRRTWWPPIYFYFIFSLENLTAAKLFQKT
jgi:hypothetical protein